MKLYQAKKIYTVDSDFSVATGIVMDDKEIIEVGDFHSLSSQYADAKIINTYKNDYMYPGLIDPHTHSFAAAIFIGSTSLIDYKDWDFGKYGFVPACYTKEEVINRINHDLKKEDKDIYAFYGYHEVLHGGITRKDLDALSDKCIVLFHGTCHGCVMSSTMMEKVAIDMPADTYGLGYDENNELNGVFVEQAYFPYSSKIINLLNNEENLKQGILKYLENMKINGVVAVCEYVLGIVDFATEIKFNQSLSSSEYPLFIQALPFFQKCLLMNNMDDAATFKFIDNLADTSSKNNFSVLKHLKIYFDGAIIDHQIKTSQPLKNGHNERWNYPFADRTMDTFKSDIERYWKAGYNFSIHSQGDDSQIKFAEVFRDLNKEFPRKDYIASLQHFGFSSDEFFEIVNENELKLHISALPLYVDIMHIWERANLYPDTFLTDYFLRLRDVEENKHLSLAFHTDAMNNPTNPLKSMYKAITRKDKNGVIHGKDQTVKPSTALKAITIESARQISLEDKLGSLEAGKSSSFIILEHDILEDNAQVLDDIKIKAFYMDNTKIEV